MEDPEDDDADAEWVEDLVLDAANPAPEVEALPEVAVEDAEAMTEEEEETAASIAAKTVALKVPVMDWMWNMAEKAS